MRQQQSLHAASLVTRLEEVKVFLSYASADRAMARDLAVQMEKAGFDVFFFDDLVEPGGNVPLAIGKALDRANAMVVLLSPDTAKSEWVQWEIEHALTQPRFKHRLIPVMTRRTNDFPWILRELQLIDATVDRKGAGKRIVDALKRADAAA